MEIRRGFTLIELMVTIAVLGVIATMAAPSFSSMLAKQNLNADSRNLINTLNNAKTQAVLLRTTTTVHLNTSGSNTNISYYWNPSKNNTLTSPSGLNTVVFRNDGTTTSVSTDTSFVICNSKSNTTKTFSLSSMGMIYATPSTDGTC